LGTERIITPSLLEMINICTCLTAKGKRPMMNINLTEEALLILQKCFNDDDATHHEKYLKTYHGKTYIKKRFKSYLTG
jgi:hypothetical protein